MICADKFQYSDLVRTCYIVYKGNEISVVGLLGISASTDPYFFSGQYRAVQADMPCNAIIDL